MTDEQRDSLLALDAATCSIEELNMAALLIGGLGQYIKQGKHNRIWSHIAPVSDIEWAAGFAMDALMTMSGEVNTDPIACIVYIEDTLSSLVFYPIDRNATGRAAMCECIHRARLAHWQKEEK
jgi:hypothetical protein